MTDLFNNELWRMLGWKSPYGTAMLHGKVETRMWDTAYRGKVLIYHTLDPFTTDDLIEIAGDVQYARLMKVVKNDPTLELRGTAFAIGTLVHTRPMRLVDEDRCFVKFNPNEKRFCHFYSNVHLIEPFKIKGTQSFPNLYPYESKHAEIINQIKIVK